MGITIITDSTSDITPEMAREMQVSVIPLIVDFEGKSYRDGVDLTRDAFYEKLSSAKELPKTSQTTPGQILPLFEEALARGDEVVCLLIASELSGGYVSALSARTQVSAPERIHIVESRTVTLGLYLLVKYACRLREEGRAAAEIAEIITEAAGRVYIYAMIGDLKYLVMGGRLPAAGATIGKALSLRPMIRVYDGKISVSGVVRSTKKAQQWLLEKLKEHGHQPGVPVIGLHTQYPEMMQPLYETMRDEVGQETWISLQSGIAVGTHAGPGAFGIAFLEK